MMRLIRDAFEWKHGLIVIGLLAVTPAFAEIENAEMLAQSVTIYRDTWGVPHIDGPTDASVVFGFAYAQAEDYFWQVEDTYIQALGRYSEINGEAGVDGDMLNRLFEIVSISKAGYGDIDPKIRELCDAYAAGINFYLERNPDVKPRLLREWEGWHVLCFERHMQLNWLMGRTHAPRGKMKPMLEEIRAAIGSNAWAIGPSKTRDGTTMLFVNPHQPWFGSGQFTEGHLRSAEGWNFSGSTYPGGPFPTMGHNEYLGWTHTANHPDVGDVYREVFDKPDRPLEYRYGDGYRKATEWKDTIKVKTAEGMEERTYTFQKTHHGPIIAREDETHRLAVKVARLFDGSRMEQAYQATRAKNFEEWRAAFALLKLQMFNTVYADRDGNIFYVYNGTIPRRDPKFDWTQPLDGSDPATEWQGFHSFDELPQVLNPISGYVQNCNSSPFTTTDDGSPSEMDFPGYMVEEKHDDMRRAKVSRYLLRRAEDVTFEDWQALAFDTTLYWPMTEVPKYARIIEDMKASNPALARKVKPYIDHLVDWDFKNTATTTQTPLVVEWYEQLYGRGYPVETLKAEYVNDIEARVEALATAAKNLEARYGSWKVPYGEIYRIQRHANIASPAEAPFSDDLPSLPQVGVRGPLGVAFTVYHTPATAERKMQYGSVGGSFMAVYEFGRDRVKAMSYLHFGQRAVPDSPHYFDQAALFSERKFKPAWFYWDDVLENTEASYHPGEEKR